LNAYRNFLGKPEGRRPVGIPRCIMDLREIGWGSIDWIFVARGRDQWTAVVNAVMNLRGPTKFWAVPEQLYKWRLLKKGSAPGSWIVLQNNIQEYNFI
jgi:hypothetical protein